MLTVDTNPGENAVHAGLIQALGEDAVRRERLE
jgi:hypothetical protein